MSKIDNSGPAFPRPASEYTKNGTCPDGNDAIDWAPGMSLRDWFAGMALSGLVPNAAWDYSSGPCNASAAERCYAIADAMLTARQKQ